MESEQQAFDMSVEHTVGVSSGMTIQFLEADWRVPGVRGIRVSEAAFDIIEGLIQPLRPSVEIDKFGVTALTLEQTRRVAGALVTTAQEPGSEQLRGLLLGVSDYLARLINEGRGVHVCGI